MPTRLSIFPLPGAILFPGLHLPLHVFEPRYRALVGDALARDRRIAMIQPQRAGDDAPLYDRPHLSNRFEPSLAPDGVEAPMRNVDALKQLIGSPDLSSKRWVWATLT